MLDQYGDPVPDDLVVLTVPYPSEEAVLPAYYELVEQAMSVPWYEAKGTILVSWEAFPDNFDDADPSAHGLTYTSVDRIADALKRHSAQDGFYHA